MRRSWNLLSSNCVCGCWRISHGAADGRCRIFSPTTSLRPRGAQRQANCGKPSPLRSNRTRPPDICLWIHRNALYFQRPTLVARVDLQTNVLRGAIADGAAAEIIRDIRGACPERSRRAQNDNDGLRFCSFLTCSSSSSESYLARFYERIAPGS